MLYFSILLHFFVLLLVEIFFLLLHMTMSSPPQNADWLSGIKRRKPDRLLKSCSCKVELSTFIFFILMCETLGMMDGALYIVAFVLGACILDGSVMLQVGLNVLIQRANRLSPATRMIVQRFVPFTAVGGFQRHSVLGFFPQNFPQTHQTLYNISLIMDTSFYQFWFYVTR